MGRIENQVLSYWSRQVFVLSRSYAVRIGFGTEIAANCETNGGHREIVAGKLNSAELQKRFSKILSKPQPKPPQQQRPQQPQQPQEQPEEPIILP